MIQLHLFCILIVILILCCMKVSAFMKSHRLNFSRMQISRKLQLTKTNNHNVALDKRQESINSMSIDEIKSELDLRAVNYDDCTTKSDLAQKLVDCLIKGVADPSIIDQFNQNTKEGATSDFSQEAVSQVTSKYGVLPGGLSPQVVKAMTSDPEIMRLLSDPKMQDVMKAVMTSGPDGIKKYLSDPDAMMLIKRLSQAMERAVNAA